MGLAKLAEKVAVKSVEKTVGLWVGQRAVNLAALLVSDLAASWADRWEYLSVATLVVIWEMKLAPRVGGRMTGLQCRWVQQN